MVMSARALARPKVAAAVGDSVSWKIMAPGPIAKTYEE